MSICLGVDTGGTYTDAVLVRDDREVLASAKSLTTRQDLAIGIGNAVTAVLETSGVAACDIRLAALSTTLATNALVEGQGGRVALILIGFRERDLDTHGLREALRGDPVLIAAGGHDHAGAEAAPLDLATIDAFVAEQGAQVTAFAVAAQFAVRNTAHEQQVADLIRVRCGRPVSASHHLSARLGGPKRAMTALLNARLVGLTERLIGRAQTQLEEMGIDVPLMVVRGDGALMSAAEARARPIETILSGPAASIVGARWLVGADDALVSDIGGTTTDVALIQDGKPTLDPAGARVGPYRTMVEAVAMRTTGLGGDSEVHVIEEGLDGGVLLGPRRVVPISLMATEASDVVHAALDEALRRETPRPEDGRFLRAVPGVPTDGLGARDSDFLSALGASCRPASNIMGARLAGAALDRLVARGLVQIAGVTPSDAAHVLALHTAWDRAAAEKAVMLLARRRTGAGLRQAADAEAMARLIVDQMTRQTSRAVLEAGFAADPEDFGAPSADLAKHPLVEAGLGAGHSGIVRVSTGLALPIIGLGASAGCYYPAVGRRLGTDMQLPEHGKVANAIGAIVGRVTARRRIVVTSPAEGRYRIHLPDAPRDVDDLNTALDCAQSAAEQAALRAAQAAGASAPNVVVSRDIREARMEARVVFVEAEITAEASGRPRIAVSREAHFDASAPT